MIKEIKFDKIDAINHLEKIHKQRLDEYSFGTAYYTGEPRFYYCFHGEKRQWVNPSLYPFLIKSLFYPGNEHNVISMSFNIYEEQFSFVVRND